MKNVELSDEELALIVEALQCLYDERKKSVSHAKDIFSGVEAGIFNNIIKDFDHFARAPKQLFQKLDTIRLKKA